jgi:triacylglycerol lipase
VPTPAFESQATAFSVPNALLLAQASQAAYLDEAGARAKMAQLGLPTFKWIDLCDGLFDDLYAFAASDGGFVILAFRGTKSFQNWMSDLYSTPARFSWLFEGAPEVGDVHAGFGHALRDAWNKIVDAVEAIAPRPHGDIDDPSLAQQPSFWITGHSLGGALAAISGAAFSMLPSDSLHPDGVIRPVSGIYTFGQPRIGLHGFCGHYDHMLQPKTFRFINKRDLVPRVPFRGWDYDDVGQVIHFTDDNTPEREGSQWTSLLARTFQSLTDAFEMFTGLRQDVGDHSMDGYQQLVQSQAAALSKLKF